MRFHENAFPRNAFHKIIFREIQEKHDEDKASKPRLHIICLGHIVRKDLLYISAGCLMNNTGV